MLKIALCDDDSHVIQKLEALLQKYLDTYSNLASRIFLFESGESLLYAAEECGGFDLYILDVIMPGQNGIEVGLRLREQEDDGEIIYLTTSKDYAADSYNTDAFFYLLKPVDEEKLFEVLDRVIKKLYHRQTEGMIVNTAHGVQRVLFDRILYVERVLRIARYYCTDGVIDTSTIHGSFQTVMAPLLKDSRFFLCGASFIFNLQHITAVDGSVVVFDTHAKASIPRRTSAAFKRVWGNYWLKDGFR